MQRYTFSYEHVSTNYVAFRSFRSQCRDMRLVTNMFRQITSHSGHFRRTLVCELVTMSMPFLLAVCVCLYAMTRR